MARKNEPELSELTATELYTFGRGYAKHADVNREDHRKNIARALVVCLESWRRLKPDQPNEKTAHFAEVFWENIDADLLKSGSSRNQLKDDLSAIIRCLFGTKVKATVSRYKSIIEYFFDEKLTNEEAEAKAAAGLNKLIREINSKKKAVEEAAEARGEPAQEAVTVNPIYKGFAKAGYAPGRYVVELTNDGIKIVAASNGQ